MPTNCNRVLRAINNGQADGLRPTIDGTHNPNVALADLGLTRTVTINRVRLGSLVPDIGKLDISNLMVNVLSISFRIAPGMQTGFEPNPTDSETPQNTGQPQITPCDRKFASIFGDSDAVARTAYEYNGAYRGLDPATRARAAGLSGTGFSSPVWDAEHLYNFPHLSGNLAGTANADIYVPGNYTGQPTGPTTSSQLNFLVLIDTHSV
jgi:hypothetical protein